MKSETLQKVGILISFPPSVLSRKHIGAVFWRLSWKVFWKVIVWTSINDAIGNYSPKKRSKR
ncbi:hypothetical protein RchiOBHm_Chr2g0149451 [Rosa chinensis]|uniref:Uncharacterized protein n=1 Tax=Rosa chinensis TaxID=74649 RepID=A0A2P6RZN4_ROSCH|nr:hypothetical protein RchiOBHm_Chr3g0448871 [Rosa chinensis]PRQ51885.1 hypothetical protein RchiOBHm_Chr2g0149451 [Rosa chinensis]